MALAAALGLGVPGLALAQHHGGGGPPGGGGGFPGGMRGMGQPGGIGGRGGFPRSMGGPPPNVPSDPRNTVSPMRGGLQLGPPGRWWDDKHFSKQLQLRPEQQRRMDTIFEQNRTTLLKRFETLEQEEQRMGELTHARTLDESALFAQIDRVAQARADLEKANTHLLFQIRSEMDADQLSKLEEHR
ncbi:MAG TPA: hypothetical protein VM865_08285 [Acidobacteriaceae bacterium]|nr:hypothetical protein [Acidobacteriaceae bacterium]